MSNDFFKNQWKKLNKPLKVIFIFWFIDSLFALEELNVFQWFVVWVFGCFLFVAVPYFFLKQKNSTENSEKNIYSLNGILNIFKLESTKEMEQNASNEIISSNDKLDFGAAEAILNHVKVLADTINNTLDEEEFEQALIDIKSRLQLLSKYEKYNIFVGCTPSEDLRAINENEYLTRKKFRTRVYEARLSGILPVKPQKKVKKEEIYIRIENPKKSMSTYDLERFAIMCNAGMEREEEMKQYEQSEEQEE